MWKKKFTFFVKTLRKDYRVPNPNISNYLEKGFLKYIQKLMAFKD